VAEENYLQYYFRKKEDSVTNKNIDPNIFPCKIPVFPLEKCLLLPKATLPLNIFEPKYISMIDDALAGDRFIGIIQPLIKTKNKKEQKLESVGCLGKISTYIENDDNTYIVKLTGICRFNLINETKTDFKYRKFEVNYNNFLNDLSETNTISDKERKTLLKIIAEYLNVNDLTTDWEAISDTKTEILINIFSMLSPFNASEKQALLEAITIKKRSEVLIALSELAIASRNDNKTTFMQ
jgi:Lon protease-like protein|tara:strand:+ start:326 stop:1039 length:714 start_codon:yes stop_codon:yes gene_type:complete